MYSVRVRGTPGQPVGEGASSGSGSGCGGAVAAAAPASREEGPSTSASAAASPQGSPPGSVPTTPGGSRRRKGGETEEAPEGTTHVVDSVPFSAGNPRVEHITGTVHLYRHLPPAEQQQQQRQQQVEEEEEGADVEITAVETGGEGEEGDAELPPERTGQLCILALPSDMGFPELCAFMGAYFEKASAREVRLVRREGGRSVCLVLLRFEAQKEADAFYSDFNGRPFCLLEPELICRLVWVKEVELQRQQKSLATAVGEQPPPPGATELPTCPVCLERLDHHISGIVTTVCNHRFHNDCLRRWGDTSCPVCRYCQNSAAATSRCAVCATSADLWICLICGHVGCGRYRGSHAATHWQASGHGYALELETQRVWDYVNDTYVHRLIQSKTDGKLVEVPSPAPQPAAPSCSGARPPSRGAANGAPSECGSECYYGGGQRGMDPEMEEALVLSKLDALASEYNHLLVTQLESQRHYFENLMAQEGAETADTLAAANEGAAAAQAAADAARSAAAEAERRRHQAESKLAETSGRLKKAEEERQWLKQLSDSLLANQKEFQERLKAAEERAVRATAERESAVADLQEQVRDLMVFIQARDIIERASGGSESGGGKELEGGTVLPIPEAPQQQGGGGPGAARRSGKKKK